MFKRGNGKLFYVLAALPILFTAAAIYFFLQPSTTTIEVNDNTSIIETSYDYQATITPNVLYPNGGTVDIGEKIFKKITSAIPFNLKSTISSERIVMAKGTHEVELIIKADELWERIFPLEQKQEFEQKGTELSVMDHTYKIDLEQVKSFILQVEDETGIRPNQYTLEILPNIQGTINDSGVEKAFQLQDRLIFQFSFEEILLASEKSFTTMTSFTSSQVMANTFHFFGQELPFILLRIICTLLSVFSLLLILFVIKSRKTGRRIPILSETEIINKKYSSRIISVSQKINIVQKSIFILDSFKSVIKIADEKELPIFSSKDHKEESTVYFIVDGDYLYTYETNKMTETEKKSRNDKAYARG
ncbi:DUF5305 family protein [Neobacillus sp. FSL H8-0543]|uniref:DUF5305 family protein n=1 Tax=Neobacillus sp. FSL H8-0543 TaxID=2954672 RepID=UPI003158C77D